MKISELINELELKKKDWGDIEILYLDGETSTAQSIDEVTIQEFKENDFNYEKSKTGDLIAVIK